MSFPPDIPSIPSSVVTATLNGLTPPIPDSAFLGSVLGSANVDSSLIGGIPQITDGLFTNPLFSQMREVDDAISSLSTLTSMADAADALPGAPGGAADALTGVIGHMKDLTTMFSNMATNIVPVNLDMNSLIKGQIGSMSDIGGQSSEMMKSVTPFVQKLGIPSMGSVMNQINAEFSLNQMCGTVDPTNPCPLLGKYSSMLSNMATTATQFLSSITDAISNVMSAVVDGFLSAITGLLSSVEGGITAFASPIASFGSDMFNSIKNQMAVGTGMMLRYMNETNPSLAFNITGMVNGVLPSPGAFSGIVTPSFASAITQYPSVVKQNNANNPPPPTDSTKVMTSTTTDNPAPNVDQLRAVVNQAEEVKDAFKSTVDAFTAAAKLVADWRTANNYDAVKNAQNDSPEAMSAYQALKAQLLASDIYKNADTLQTTYKINETAYYRMLSVQRYFTDTGVWSSNPNGPWAINNPVNVGGQTYPAYTVASIPTA